MAPPNVPAAYTIWLLWLEPGVTVFAAFAVWFFPEFFLKQTDAASAPSSLLGMPVGTHVAVKQLANLCNAYALNEALVLRSSNDMKVWKACLAALLCVDLGHIISLYPLGFDMYWDITKWNMLAWGNYASVYYGAATKICFFLGVGMGGPKKLKAKARKSIKAATEEVNGTTTPPSSINSTPAQSTRRRKNKSVSGS